MRTLLICHREEPLNHIGLARWLQSFSTLVGIVVLEETRARKWRRVRREIKRVGPARFLDVLAFRAYRRIALRGEEQAWETAALADLARRYPTPPSAPELVTTSPNTADAERFIRDAEPDLVIARCKSLLAERIYSIPRSGALVMHPGICPEYRNAHGCFWALVNGDSERVGMTLLRVDRGVDTGPVYGHFSYPFDPVAESPFVIQERVVFDNLPLLETALREIVEGRAVPIDVRGRVSAEWGQPWLTKYLVWHRALRSVGA